MANAAYRFGLASDNVTGMARILQTLESKELKGWGVGQIARRNPAAHLQNGSRQCHSFLSRRRGSAV